MFCRPPHGEGRTERQVKELLVAGVRDLSAMMEALGAMESPYGIAWYGDLYVKKTHKGFGARAVAVILCQKN
jgi:hypothetical protein